MKEYKRIDNTIVLNSKTHIPMSEDNRDYIEFKQWLKDNKKTIDDIEVIKDDTVIASNLKPVIFDTTSNKLVYIDNGEMKDVPEILIK